jgi:uncharacterized membrane protein
MLNLYFVYQKLVTDDCVQENQVQHSRCEQSATIITLLILVWIMLLYVTSENTLNIVTALNNASVNMIMKWSFIENIGWLIGMLVLYLEGGLCLKTRHEG